MIEQANGRAGQRVVLSLSNELWFVPLLGAEADYRFVTSTASCYRSFRFSQLLAVLEHKHEA